MKNGGKKSVTMIINKAEISSIYQSTILLYKTLFVLVRELSNFIFNTIHIHSNKKSPIVITPGCFMIKRIYGTYSII